MGVSVQTVHQQRAYHKQCFIVQQANVMKTAKEFIFSGRIEVSTGSLMTVSSRFSHFPWHEIQKEVLSWIRSTKSQ